MSRFFNHLFGTLVGARRIDRSAVLPAPPSFDDAFAGLLVDVPGQIGTCKYCFSRILVDDIGADADRCAACVREDEDESGAAN